MNNSDNANAIVKDLLINQPNTIYEKNTRGLTPLMVAVINSNSDAINLFEDNYSQTVIDVMNLPVFGEGPFIVDRKCYYTMERMYPASLGILVGEGENIIDITAKLGQLYFQKTDESHSKNTVYDGYEYGMTSIQRICGAMSIDIAEVVDDMALFCSLCFQYSVLPLD